MLSRFAGEAMHRGLDWARRAGAIGPDSRRGRRFGRFGERSVICWPPNTLLNERYIHIGAHTMIGPHVALSAGMAVLPSQAPFTKRSRTPGGVVQCHERICGDGQRGDGRARVAAAMLDRAPDHECPRVPGVVSCQLRQTHRLGRVAPGRVHVPQLGLQRGPVQ